MGSESAAVAAAVLDSIGDTASLWFCFGGDPDAPDLVLADRAEDPKGQGFVPKAKALASQGKVAQGIASRKAGGVLTMVSRSPFPDFVTGLAAWAAEHVGAHRGLLGLKDARFTQVDKSNSVVDQQSDPTAWDALDAAVARAEAGPKAEPDEITAATLAALAGAGASRWFWISQAEGDAPPMLLLLDRAQDPKGAELGAS